jgi:hypothetical protein
MGTRAWVSGVNSQQADEPKKWSPTGAPQRGENLTWGSSQSVSVNKHDLLLLYSGAKVLERLNLAVSADASGSQFLQTCRSVALHGDDAATAAHCCRSTNESRRRLIGPRAATLYPCPGQKRCSRFPSSRPFWLRRDSQSGQALKGRRRRGDRICPRRTIPACAASSTA